ncbi:MAG: ABC transporter substrate-binding protein [Desulfarculales bacterium]|jgi:NitT/TauT family transport system substrate-binding protein|nr:ABC transporter substrate-binding protein [Desulfarculales bacterium]
MKKWVYWAILAILIPAGADYVQAGEATNLKVGYLPASGHGKIFVAYERGYFKEEGFDAELISFINSADGIAAIRSGKIDVGGFGTVAPLLQISTGADLRIIGGLMGTDSAILAMGEKADSIKTVSDLRGLRVATVRMASGDAVLRGALLEAGLSWKDDLEIFELKSPGAVIEAIKNGQVDAGMVWGPHDVAALAQGLKIVLISDDMYPGHPCCRLAVTGEEYEQDLDKWKRFLRALLKAERYAFTGGVAHQRQVVEDISKYAPLDTKLIDQSYYHSHLDQSTDPNASGVLTMWEVVKAVGFAQKDENISRFIEIAAYREALESLLAEEPDDAYWKNLKPVFEERDTGNYGGGRAQP